MYGLWSGYYRGHEASFMGVNRQTGWRGGRRVLREVGHGAYLVWNLAQVCFSARYIDLSKRRRRQPLYQEPIQNYFLPNPLGLCCPGKRSCDWGESSLLRPCLSSNLPGHLVSLSYLLNATVLPKLKLLCCLIWQFPESCVTKICERSLSSSLKGCRERDVNFMGLVQIFLLVARLVHSISH